MLNYKVFSERSVLFSAELLNMVGKMAVQHMSYMLRKTAITWSVSSTFWFIASLIAINQRQDSTLMLPRFRFFPTKAHHMNQLLYTGSTTLSSDSFQTHYPYLVLNVQTWHQRSLLSLSTICFVLIVVQNKFICFVQLFCPAWFC